jgi:hypothetical protein
MVAIAVMISVAIEIATAAVTVPSMVVRPAAIAGYPVSIEIATIFIPGSCPSGSGIRRTAPIAGVPDPAAVHGIPITVDPDIPGSRSVRPHSDNSWRRRCTDADSDIEIRAE